MACQWVVINGYSGSLNSFNEGFSSFSRHVGPRPQRGRQCVKAKGNFPWEGLRNLENVMDACKHKWEIIPGRLNNLEPTVPLA